MFSLPPHANICQALAMDDTDQDDMKLILPLAQSDLRDHVMGTKASVGEVFR